VSKLIEKTVKNIRPPDRECMERAAARQDTLTKPTGCLGRLEELSIRLAGMQCKDHPQATRKAVIVMAADHGVVAEGTSAYPQEVTAQMVLNFVHGGAAINVISRQVGARVIVVDIGVAGDISSYTGILHKKIAMGTANMCKGPAMTLQQAELAVETGIEIVNAEIDRGLDIVATGEMGIGNTTASSAVCSVFTGKSVEMVTGRGTGINDSQLQLKIEKIRRAIDANRPDSQNALDALAKIGGLEIGGLAGVMLGAAARRVPVMVDGFISGAAALVAVGLCPLAVDYMIAGHVSVEPGHRHLLRHLGLKPLLDLDMRLGEGTGAVMGMSVVETACRILSEMATFEEAGVSNKGD